MQISEDSWTELNKYLVHHDHGRISTAPQHVYAVVLSLVDPSAIRAGIATYDASGESTTWRVCAVTDRSLAFAEVEFDTRFYTGGSTRAKRNVSNSATECRRRRSPSTRLGFGRWVPSLSSR